MNDWTTNKFDGEFLIVDSKKPMVQDVSVVLRLVGSLAVRRGLK